MGYAAVVQALVGLAGQAQAGKITAEQMALLKKQLADQAGIPLPDLEKIAATELPPSHVAALGVDTGLRQNQLESISALRDIAANGGMSLDDRVAQDSALSRSNSATNRNMQGIRADLASRGQLNSGAQLQTSLAAQQQGANSARQSGMEAAASAQRRKMDALREIASESGGLRNQDYAEKSAAAQAADQRDAWNASAQEKAKYYNAGLPEQNFNNQLAKISGQQASTGALSSALSSEAQGVRNMYGGLGVAANAATKGLTGQSTKDKPADTYSWDGPDGPGGGVPQYSDNPSKLDKNQFDDEDGSFWSNPYPGGS